MNNVVQTPMTRRNLTAVRVISMDKPGGVILDIHEGDLRRRKNGNLTNKTAYLLEIAISHLEAGNYVFLEGVEKL